MEQIDAKYQALGGATGFLKAPQGNAQLCPDGLGRYRHYAGGSIYWHPDTEAHVVYGDIFKKWAALGWENSWLGYPVSDEEAYGDGRRSRFQNGAIEYSQTRGTRDLEGVGCAVFFASSSTDHGKHRTGQQAKKRRLISLSVFGDAGAPRYASVWTSHGGPEQRTIHDLSEQQYLAWQKANAAEDFYTTILAVNSLPVPVTGLRVPVFAAAAEKVSPSQQPVSKYHLGLSLPATNANSLEYWTQYALLNNYIPTSLDLYEWDGEAKAAIVLSPNPNKLAWNWNSLTKEGDQQAKHHDLHTRHGERPALVTRQVKGTRLMLYREDHVGFWFSLAGQSEAQVRDSTDKAAAEGKYPISITAGVDGYTTIWASRKDPLPNRWAIVGREVPSLSTVDDAVMKYMRDANIRCASVAVGKDARLVYARTFTWAPPTYSIATPRHIFRIGSCTKVFAALVAHQLIDENKLSLDDKMLAKLGITTSLRNDGAVATGAHKITVRQLLNHTNGLADVDMNRDRDILVKALGKPFAEVSKYDCVRHNVGFPLKIPEYTNNGYVALGAVIERVDTVGGKSRSLFAGLKDRVLKPLGLKRPAVSGWSLDKKIPWSVQQHSAMLTIEPNAMATDNRETRTGYENGHPGHGEACGSLAFSAADIIKMLTSFTCGKDKNPILSTNAVARMWPPNELPNGFLRNPDPPTGYDEVFWHNGAVAGGHGVFAVYRNDDGDNGASVATFYNKDAQIDGPAWDPIIAGVTSWPTHDLFTSLDITAHA